VLVQKTIATITCVAGAFRKLLYQDSIERQAARTPFGNENAASPAIEAGPTALHC
jgi:hypothetical protein